MNCKFCGESKKLIRAHIIPEAFFRVLRDGERPPVIVSDIAGVYPKRSPIGVYDTGILCIECEREFGPTDEYGAVVLVNELEQRFQPFSSMGQELAYVGSAIDQEMLKMFFLSVLWRAAVSTQAYYKRVTLGPHESRLHTILHSDECPGLDEFSIVLSKWRSSGNLSAIGPGLPDPHPERWGGINAVRIYFGSVVAYIKVDKRPYPEEIREFSLGASNDVVLIARDLHSSKEMQVLRRILNAASGPALDRLLAKKASPA